MRRPFVYLVLAAACWGVGTVISKQALDAIAPVVLLVVQLTVSVLLLTVLTARPGPQRSGGRSERCAMLLGLLNPGLSYALALVGLSTIAANTSVLIWATEPALIVLLAVVFLGERLTLPLVGALGLALTGVLLVVYAGGISGSPVGITLTFGAVLACAVYTVLARVWAVDTATATITLGQQSAALVFALALGLGVAAFGTEGLSGPVPLGEVPLTAWVAAVISGAIYYALAFWLYLSALKQVPASVAGSFLTLVPVFGVAAALATGERLDNRQWLGAALVVASVAVITKDTSRRSDRTLGVPQ
jgi:drug/metabolite transporter (DMT)-like permease